jgi:thioesterase domain-containing protein/acyl carrier protein
VLSEIRIADERGGFLACGQEGEVLARGPSVFDGYLDDPEANARAFVDGWFRTGDLGRLDADGYLTISGRIKELINRGGEKIGPAEVERVIAEHPGVARVCVFGIPHPTLGQEVAAAVVPVEGALVSESSVIDFARTRLAAFKVPCRVAFTSEFPQTPARKIDRRALTEAYSASLAHAGPPRGPAELASSPTEAAVAELWQKLLRQDHMRRDADFFLEGGDSLKAAELFAAIRQRFGVHLNLREIFGDGATVRGLALLVERVQDAQRGLRGLPERIMPINIGAERIALFGIPGSDGYPGSFLHLGRLIDVDQPFYGLESRGLDGAHSPLERIEDIAADHLNAIRQLQPGGPYFLLGACFGGRVAYEMARQLESEGEQIGMLAMLDPSPPFTDSKGQRRRQSPAPAISHDWTRLPRFVGRRIRLYANEVSKLEGRQRITYLRSKLDLLREMARHKNLFRGDRSEMQKVAVYEANQRAGRRYVPGPYRGPAIIALTEGRVLTGARNYRFDWLELIPQAQSPQYVPGRDTGDMLIPPNVYALAKRVNAWVQEAQQRVGAPDHVLPRRPAATVGALG